MTDATKDLPVDLKERCGRCYRNFRKQKEPAICEYCQREITSEYNEEDNNK